MDTYHARNAQQYWSDKTTALSWPAAAMKWCILVARVTIYLTNVLIFLIRQDSCYLL